MAQCPGSPRTEALIPQLPDWGWLTAHSWVTLQVFLQLKGAALPKVMAFPQEQLNFIDRSNGDTETWPLSSIQNKNIKWWWENGENCIWTTIKKEEEKMLLSFNFHVSSLNFNSLFPFILWVKRIKANGSSEKKKKNRGYPSSRCPLGWAQAFVAPARQFHLFLVSRASLTALQAFTPRAHLADLLLTTSTSVLCPGELDFTPEVSLRTSSHCFLTLDMQECLCNEPTRKSKAAWIGPALCSQAT